MPTRRKRTNFKAAAKKANEAKKEEKSTERVLQTAQHKVKNLEKKVNFRNHIKTSQQATGRAKQRILSAKKIPTSGPSRNRNSALRQYEEVARAISFPGEFETPRLSNKFVNVPTAVVGLKNIITVPQNVTSETASIFTSNFSFLVSTRIPECANIIYYAPNSATFNYTFYGSYPTGETLNVPAITFTTPALTANPGNLNVPVSIAYGLADAGYQPHGPKWYAGAAMDETRYRYFWLDVGCVFKITAAVATANGAAVATHNINFDMWNPEGISESVGYTPSSGLLTNSFTFTTATRGYYRLRHTINVSTAGTVAVTYSAISYTSNTGAGSTSPGLFGHQAMRGYSSNDGKIKAARLVSVSAMYSNTSSVMDEAGMCVMAQLPRTAHWVEYIEADPFAHLTQIEEQHAKFPAKTGEFGYLKFAGDEDQDFRANTTTMYGMLMDSHWPLNFANTSLMILVSNISTFAARSAIYTFGYGLEYQTSDGWSGKKKTNLTRAAVDAAIDHMRDLPQFSENPLHLSKIWGSIKKVANEVVGGINKYVPAFMEAGDVLASAIGV